MPPVTQRRLSTEAPRIAKELIAVFARMGVPDEILTDQGPNFMSALLEEVYRLLQITRIRTTPYHPQTDGLVERFKAMLKKFVSRNQKDWDEYLLYLLFAYRENPGRETWRMKKPRWQLMWYRCATDSRRWPSW